MRPVTITIIKTFLWIICVAWLSICEVFSLELEPILDKRCSEGCTSEYHGISCTVSKVLLCDEAIANNEFTVHQSQSRNFPSAPESLNADEFTQNLNNSSTANKQLGINVTWGIPRGASYQFVTGFLLAVKSTNSLTSSHCIYFNMSNTQWQYSKTEKLQMYYPCLRDLITAGQTLFLEMYSLPLPLSQKVESSITMNYQQGSNNVQTDNPRKWKPSIKFSTMDDESNGYGRKLIVQFTTGPTRYRFTNYVVDYRKAEDRSSYIDRKYLIVDLSDNATMKQVTFYKVCAGMYKIAIHVEKSNLLSECVCGIKFGIPGFCQDCPHSLTAPFEVSPGVPCSTVGSKVSEEPITENKVLRTRDNVTTLKTEIRHDTSTQAISTLPRVNVYSTQISINPDIEVGTIASVTTGVVVLIAVVALLSKWFLDMKRKRRTGTLGNDNDEKGSIGESITGNSFSFISPPESVACDISSISAIFRQTNEQMSNVYQHKTDSISLRGYNV